MSKSTMVLVFKKRGLKKKQIMRTVKAIHDGYNQSALKESDYTYHRNGSIVIAVLKLPGTENPIHPIPPIPPDPDRPIVPPDHCSVH